VFVGGVEGGFRQSQQSCGCVGGGGDLWDEGDDGGGVGGAEEQHGEDGEGAFVGDFGAVPEDEGGDEVDGGVGGAVEESAVAGAFDADEEGFGGCAVVLFVEVGF
jgi:hypothetical protein